MSISEIVKWFFSLFQKKDGESVVVKTNEWEVDYSMLLECVKTSQEGNGVITYYTAEKTVKDLESKKTKQWCLLVSSSVKGQTHGPCIVFNKGDMYCTDYESAKQWYLNCGAVAVAIAG